MNSADPQSKPQRNRLHIFFITVTTIATILISLYYLSSGSFIVFQNLFYIPIILSCMYYTMRGFIYSVCLAVLYLLLILFFTAESGIITQALVRAVLFIAIAGIVTFLSTRRKRAEQPKSTTSFPTTPVVTPDGPVFSKTTQKMESPDNSSPYIVLFRHHGTSLTANFG
jgi:glucan phosphoethanolaminetransferase (alkaline phosphatase superfamily)